MDRDRVVGGEHFAVLENPIQPRPLGGEFALQLAGEIAIRDECCAEAIGGVRCGVGAGCGCVHLFSWVKMYF